MKRVDVFFYGSYINPEVLAEAGLEPSPIRVARVPGFETVIGRLANLERSEGAVAWGIVAPLTHQELDRLYGEHARSFLGTTYLPEAVLYRSEGSHDLAALTYIAPELPEGPVSAEYVERIVGPGKTYGFPESYLQHLRSFLV